MANQHPTPHVSAIQSLDETQATFSVILVKLAGALAHDPSDKTAADSIRTILDLMYRASKTQQAMQQVVPQTPVVATAGEDAAGVQEEEKKEKSGSGKDKEEEVEKVAQRGGGKM